MKPLKLTPREEDVVRAMMEGKTNKEIASTLGLSVNTVKVYNVRIWDKVGISGRWKLMNWAREYFAQKETI